MIEILKPGECKITYKEMNQLQALYYSNLEKKFQSY